MGRLYVILDWCVAKSFRLFMGCFGTYELSYQIFDGEVVDGYGSNGQDLNPCSGRRSGLADQSPTCYSVPCIPSRSSLEQRTNSPTAISTSFPSVQFLPYSCPYVSHGLIVNTPYQISTI